MLKIIGGIISIVCMVIVIYDVLSKRPDLSTGKKILWVLFSVVLPIVSFAMYYAIYRRKLW